MANGNKPVLGHFPPGQFPPDTSPLDTSPNVTSSPMLFRFAARFARVRIGDSSRNRFTSSAYFAQSQAKLFQCILFIGASIRGESARGGKAPGGTAWGWSVRSPVNHLMNKSCGDDHCGAIFHTYFILWTNYLILFNCYGISLLNIKICEWKATRRWK